MIIMANIRNIIFAKVFSQDDVEEILAAVAGKSRVVFVDTPATEHLLGLVRELQEQKIEVVVRDHHDFPAPRNEREEQIAEATAALRELVGSNATISTRNEHPACSLLVREGEFKDEGTVIVADPSGIDGLLSSIKAIGVSYPELDDDAVVLDGPRSEQKPERLSLFGNLLVKGMATLPPFNPRNPAASEKPKGEFFSSFVSAVEGDAEARASLEARVKAYEKTVSVAEELVSKATRPAIGVKLVDTVGSSRFDLATLTQGLEASGTAITVVRKDSGPIAAEHGGVQYSLAVVQEFQQDINLQDFLPEGFESSPKAGIISNTSFLLHVSKKVWEDIILPELRFRPCNCGSGEPAGNCPAGDPYYG